MTNLRHAQEDQVLNISVHVHLLRKFEVFQLEFNKLCKYLVADWNLSMRVHRHRDRNARNPAWWRQHLRGCRWARSGESASNKWDLGTVGKSNCWFSRKVSWYKHAWTSRPSTTLEAVALVVVLGTCVAASTDGAAIVLKAGGSWRVDEVVWRWGASRWRRGPEIDDFEGFDDGRCIEKAEADDETLVSAWEGFYDLNFIAKFVK